MDFCEGLKVDFRLDFFVGEVLGRGIGVVMGGGQLWGPDRSTKANSIINKENVLWHSNYSQLS